MEKKKKISIFAIFAILFVIIVGRNNSYSLNEIVVSNNRQNIHEKEEKFETVRGSKLKIGDYVNYDHTLQVDPNTKETIKVPSDKLTYTSYKGDLDNSGNGIGTQTVDVSGYKTKWRVYDIQGDQVLLMPETQPTAEIRTKSALGYLWYEKEAHNIAGLYGHGYGADETKEFNYEVGSRIPSENDRRTETTEGTGARPMLLKDIEEAYGITTDEQRQELNDYWDKERNPVGSNNLTISIYYPTLNKTNARATEDPTLNSAIFSEATGDIGVSKTTKELIGIKNENYNIDKLDKVHTKTYDANTGKDIQKEIIHKYGNYLGSRSLIVDSDLIHFHRGYVGTYYFSSASGYFGRGSSSEFKSYDEGSLHPRPVVFLSSANKYYKEQGEGEYATYSLIKEEESQHLKIHNPYNVNLNNVSLKGKCADRLLFESKLDAPAQNVVHINLTRANGRKVIDNITYDNIIYTVEGLPEGITYDVVKKKVSGKEEVTIQIYPKELSVVANVNKKDIYDGAKFSYNILLNRNGTKVSSKTLNETTDGKVEITKFTEKKDIIDKEGNAVKYTLDYDDFNDTVRKDNTYYNNTFAKSSKSNNNKIIYNLGIVYNKAKYEETVKEKDKNNENEKHNDKKEDIKEETEKRTELTDESSENNKEIKKENDNKNNTSGIKIPYAGRKAGLPIIGVLVGAIYSVVTKRKMLNNRNIAI